MNCEREIDDALKKLAIVYKESHYRAYDINYVKLLNENILNVDFTNYKNKQIFIWLSNLCFGLSNTDNIFQKLQTDLPSGTIICCSKKPESTTLECLTTIQIPMYWCNSSNVYLYRM